MHRDLLENIKDARLFDGLDASSKLDIIDGARKQFLPSGTSLWRQGDAPETIAMVTDGRLRVTTIDRQGVPKTLIYMVPGDTVGCAAVFGSFAYPATATAIVSTHLLCWSAERFEILMRTYPMLARNALAIVGQRTGDILRRLHEATGENAHRRIAKAILRLASEHKSSTNSTHVELKVTRQELAELSDTTLFTVSRTIAAWDRLAIVHAGRGRLIIRNLARLAVLSE